MPNKSRVVPIVLLAAVALAVAAAVVYVLTVGLGFSGQSSAPMERYLATEIAGTSEFTLLDSQQGVSAGTTRPVAVVEVVGTKPMAPNGCDIYVRYFVAVPSSAASPAPVAAQAGFAVAHVEDPDEASGPVTWRFPRDGSQWGPDMRNLMPPKYWQGKEGDFGDLERAWERKVRSTAP